MSRIGKSPIPLSDRVKIDIADRRVKVEGPKGCLEFTLPSCVSAEVSDRQIKVSCPTYATDASDRALFGMARSMLNNMVIGVSDGFRKELQIQGVGYRGQVSGKKLTLNIGFSNPVELEIPSDVELTMPDNTRIVVEGIDKQRVGQVASTIRSFRPPDPYKGKGVRYMGEQVTLKEGKTIG